MKNLILALLVFLPQALFATVDSTYTPDEYTCNGSTTTFTYTFEILEDNDIVVTTNNITTEEQIDLTLNTDYTVTGAGDASGGTIVLTSGSNCATGYTIVLSRNIDFLQETDFVDGQAFSAETLESVGDKAMLLLQQHEEEIGRSPAYQRGGTSGMSLPEPEANKYLGYDTDGELANLTVSGTGSWDGLNIPTYTELQNLTGQAAGDLAFVAGRSSAGDGGGGIFVWSAADQSANVTLDTLSGLFVPPTSDATGASGAWVRLFSGPYLAEWFGALGDGATNDYAAINAAIGYGNVKLLAKTYSYGTSLDFPTTGFSFHGQGITQTILKYTGASYGITVNAQNIDDWTMGSFTLNGYSSTSTSAAILIYGPDDFLLKDVQIIDWEDADGIQLYGSNGKGSYGGGFANITILKSSDTYSCKHGIKISGVANAASDPAASSSARANSHAFENVSVLFPEEDAIYIEGASSLTFTHVWAEDTGREIVSLVNASYKWTASGADANAYYLELAAGGDPSVERPYNVREDDDILTVKTAGSLVSGSWGYGDADTLGYDTVYVQLTDDSDPDGKPADYVELRKAGYGFYIKGGAFTFAGPTNKNIATRGITVNGGHFEGLSSLAYSTSNAYVYGVIFNGSYLSDQVPVTDGSWGGGENYFNVRHLDGYLISIRNASYKWSASGSGTNEYYMELAAGGNPIFREPDELYENVENANATLDNVEMTAGTVGSLALNEWDYGDNDALGYNTVYVRITGGLDPDSKPLDYLQAERGGLTSKNWKVGGLGDEANYIDFSTSNQLNLCDGSPATPDECFISYARNGVAAGQPSITLTAQQIVIVGVVKETPYAATFAEADTTPSVSAGNFFRSHIGAGPGTTDITTFDDGAGGQCLKIFSGNALTIFKNGATIKTITGADVTTAANRIYEFCNNGSAWIEVGN